MPPEPDDWNRMNRPAGENGGGDVYIPKQELKRLARQEALDLNAPIEYSVSSGVSDGRARVFIELRNAGGKA